MTVNPESNEKEISGERTIELTRMVRINQSTSFWHQEQTADETYKLINDEVKRSIIKLYGERITDDHYCNAPRIDEISRCQPSTLGITPIAQQVLVLPGAHFVIAHTRSPVTS